MLPDQPGIFQLLYKEIPVILESVVVALQLSGEATHAHVNIAIHFGDIPGVAGQFVLKEPQLAAVVFDIILKFLFLGNDQGSRRPGAGLAEKCPVDRTVRAACPDQVLGRIFAVHDILAVFQPDLFDLVQMEFRLCHLKQPVIELHPPDRVLVGG